MPEVYFYDIIIDLERRTEFLIYTVVLPLVLLSILNVGVTHKSTVNRTVMCRQDGRGRFPALLDDHSKCRTNSQRKSQLS